MTSFFPPYVSRVSIHAPYAGSDFSNGFKLDKHTVSIHAPYAGSDNVYLNDDSTFIVSIHAPYAGSDDVKSAFHYINYQFQSTPPMQGATMSFKVKRTTTVRFNPRPLCRERLRHGYYHAHRRQFQSTPPMQGATYNSSLYDGICISFNPRPLCRERPKGASPP